AERNCSVPGDASAGLLDVILAKIPDHRRADVDRPPDAALLKDRRVVEADDRHDLAPLLVELLIAGLRAGIWRPVRRIVERRPVDREVLSEPQEVTDARHAGGPGRRRAAEIVEGHNGLDGHVEDLWGNIA